MQAKKFNIRFTINGDSTETEVEPADTLIQVIRNDLKLTGTKRGCDYGGCGACTVTVDGNAVYSCMYPAVKANGKQIKTIEGLATRGNLDPLQEAFVAHGAAQCGYCTPGIIMASRALLDHKPNPTDQDIREALIGNLCRCTGYLKIFEAIHEAAGRAGH